ncbi:hypothetical protein ACFX2A_028712 [Malus domestica]
MKIDDSDRSSSHDIVHLQHYLPCFRHSLAFGSSGGMVDVRVSFTAVQRESLRDSGLFPYSSTIAFTNFQEHIKFPQNISRELGISFSHNMDDEYKKLIHRITPPRFMLPGNQRLILLSRRQDQHMACHIGIFFTN